jgi:hypothetical protein
VATRSKSSAKRAQSVAALPPWRANFGSEAEEETMVKNTGIVVTDEHRSAALARARGVVGTPIIKVHGVWLPDEARLDFGTWLDALAQSYGLPAPSKTSEGEIVHYGMTAKGEFTCWAGDADECAPQDVLGV